MVEELDVPPYKYEDAKERYEAVGKWLSAVDSPLVQFDPTIYPQGSFALGTAVRPLGEEDYDVDSVCLLQIGKGDVTQQHLKKMVGDRIKQHKTYERMLESEGRRCWTLKYADESKFHLDILPAIPDEYGWTIALDVPHDLAQHAICITDKKTWNKDREWPKSNPKGYLEWFKSRMRVILEERRRIIAMEKRADIQQIEDYEIPTPLQRAIQLLKRHRDVKYNGDDDKPISIIITTLAAQAYNNEAEILEALLNMIPRMRQNIQNRNGVPWVANPVNPEENFADKWVETPRKREIFFEWMEAFEKEHKALLTDHGFLKIGRYLAKSYGQRQASAAMTKYANRTVHVKGTSAAKSSSSLVISENKLSSRFNIPHREYPKWPIALQYEVKISARASKDGFKTFSFKNDSSSLQKHFSLRFDASTNVPKPFAVYWQVVNTGYEATRVNGLRGSIFLGELVQKETTLYQGMHWIECFIVKDGKCVARSGEFVVNIG